MGKTWCCIVVMLAAGGAQGADLATAQKQWESRQFEAAFQNFKVLAGQGVPAAQLQLGEMYGFGEGTPEDLKQAEFWLDKAAAAGQAEARDSLALVRERAAHKGDIAAYTRDFTGASLAYGKYGCERPAVPPQSKNNADIAKTNAAINRWRDCYATFAQRLNAALPATNTIPPDIVKLMNNDEFQQASKLIESTYARLAAEAQVVADEVTAESRTWAANTEAFAGQTAADREIFLREQEQIMRTREIGRVPGQAKK